MLLSKAAAVDLAKELWPGFRVQRAAAIFQDNWVKGRQEAPEIPDSRKNGSEYERMRRMAVTPLLGLIVTATAQALAVEGYRTKDSRDNAPIWDNVWQQNGLDSKQVRIYRGSLGMGVAHNVVLPGQNPLTGAPMVHIRGVSAKRLAAFHEDDEIDEPTYALEGTVTIENGEPRWLLRLYDDTAVYFLSCDEGGEKWAYIEHRAHDVGVLPVVPFTNLIDLDGEHRSEIAPLIPIAQRFDQDTLDRLVVQRGGSWKVRYGTGVEEPKGAVARDRAASHLQVTDILLNGSPDARFGTLDGTPLDPYIAAGDTDIRTMAAASQTPAHHLLGQISNVSADALAAAEATLMRKVSERKKGFGESWERTMRLAAWIDGDAAAANDFSSQVRWADTEIRSLSQTADALGKLAQSVGVPVELLWGRIPGWTETDSDDAKQLLEESGELEKLYRDLAAPAGSSTRPVTEPDAIR